MKKLPLTNSNLVALVDDEDYDKVAQYKWRVSKDSRTSYFSIRGGGGRGNTYLHRFILGLSKSTGIVDHIDRDTLNNQKSNLRLVSQRDNVLNSERREGSLAHIFIRMRSNPDTFSVVSSSNEITRRYFGTFETYEDAVLARDIELLTIFGLDYKYFVNDIDTIVTSSYPIKLTKAEGAKKQIGVPRPERRTYDRPTKEALHELIWSQPVVIVAKNIGCSDKCVEKWCKSYDLEKPARGFWQQLGSNKLLGQYCPIKDCSKQQGHPRQTELD